MLFRASSSDNVILCPATVAFSIAFFVALGALEACAVLFDWAYALDSLVAVVASVDVIRSSSSMTQSAVFIYYTSFELFRELNACLNLKYADMRYSEVINNYSVKKRHTKIEAGPAGIEPTTPGLKVRCSSLAELRALLRKCTVHRRNKKGVF